VHLQFSGAVDASGSPRWRIGTTDSTVVCIEAGSGAGLAGWGWEDNGWGSLGPHVYFAATGPQTLRVQRREDGIAIDQIVLSPVTFLNRSPGATKHDTTILQESPPDEEEESPGELVLYASSATIVGGGWEVVADATAAGSAALLNPDRGVAKIVTAHDAPASYAELTFTAEAGRPYRLWLRGRAERNYWGNDSVHLQFSNAVDGAGNAAYRIGTSGSAVVNLEDCSGCGISGWGWQDNGWGAGVLGPLIYFPAGGAQTLRIQSREDGLRIDQVVLSPGTYLDRAPGALKNDATILPETAGS
jgi:hypothetical protein